MEWVRSLVAGDSPPEWVCYRTKRPMPGVESVGDQSGVEILLKALKDLADPCTRADYTVADLDEVVCDIAQKAIDDYYNFNSAKTGDGE
jgi:hypothetical protein